MKVYSEREYLTVVSWAVLYEWEDCFAKEWNTEVIPLKNGLIQKIERRVRRYYHEINPKHVWKYKISNLNEVGVLIIMDAEGYYMLPTENIIPIYLDFARSMIDTIITATKDLPAFFVASKDIYNEMKDKGCHNVYFIHQCVSDQYNTGDILEKDIDVIQIGRKNPVLHEYMLKYCEDHPDIEYIYQGQDASHEYISTTRGNIGTLPGRREFVDMMRRAKVSLVSTPKCDNCRNVFGGADLVTARFYESAVFRCRMIGRYTDNEETRELELEKVCPNVQDYNEFVTALEKYLDSSSLSWNDYNDFISQNLASVRARYISDCIEKQQN